MAPFPMDDEVLLLAGTDASQAVLEHGAAGQDEPGRSQENAGQRLTARRLYISHFLSTWNSRVFEFGATLYLATIFPNTLLPLSVYALMRGIAAIILSPSVGQYIDKANRLHCVRISIVVPRFVVAASCAVFWALLRGLAPSDGFRHSLMVLLTFLACIEKLYSIMNLVAVERDWVVIIAHNDEERLSRLNSQMRRIDLICKLVGPLVIALIDSVSTEMAIAVNFAMNAISVGIEYFAIAQVYHRVPELQRPKWSNEQRAGRKRNLSLGHNLRHVHTAAQKSLHDYVTHFRHKVFLPSFAGAWLYLTVLSFAGQMVTYLLSAGYKAVNIGLTRTLAVLFEILATWIAPRFMGWIGPVRAGAWLLNSQLICLIMGLTLFWVFQDQPVISASALVGGTIFSRIGLRGFDLCSQFIIQDGVEAENRGAFSSVEAAWQNLFEIISYLSTIVCSRPEQFRWPSLLSVIAVTIASILYTTFVRLERGHLLHIGRFSSLEMGVTMRQNSLYRIATESDV